MASSSEAFEKFSIWKNSKSWLKVTVIERGQSENVHSVRIIRLDEEPSLINVIGREMHSFGEFDVSGAESLGNPAGCSFPRRRGVAYFRGRGLTLHLAYSCVILE